MKRLAALLACALAIAGARAEVDRSALLALSASVLKVEALRDQGGFALGSGVVVAPEKVVTNCHVTRDARAVNIVRGGARWTADAQLRDADHDLCLLRVPGLQASAVTLGAAERLRPGEAVTALGYTGGGGMQNSPGEVIALHRLDGARVIQSSNWFSSGASGGGLFDSQLRLVGILTFRLRGGPTHYYAAPAEWLRRLLDAPAAQAFVPVAPEPAQRPAYWQRGVADQPRFLRAASMEHDGRWPELESLAQEWVRAVASDPEPWYLMGLALDRLDRSVQARRARECSLALDPDAGPGRDRLAPADARQALQLPGPARAEARRTCSVEAIQDRP